MSSNDKPFPINLSEKKKQNLQCGWFAVEYRAREINAAIECFDFVSTFEVYGTCYEISRKENSLHKLLYAFSILFLISSLIREKTKVEPKIFMTNFYSFQFQN